MLCTSFDKERPTYKEGIEKFLQRTNTEAMDSVSAFLIYWIVKTDSSFSNETIDKIESRMRKPQ